MKKLILASASPRRHELLRQIGLNFDVITEDFDEDTGCLDPESIAVELATGKASIIYDKYPTQAIIIAADTIVWQAGRRFGKPTDGNDAFYMLNNLQGGTHHVYTGVCAIDATDNAKTVKSFVDCAEVRMRKVSEEEILSYISTGEPFGKAGAYAIQGKGACFIEKISGDYYTVVGLPLAKLCLCLRELGFDVTGCW